MDLQWFILIIVVVWSNSLDYCFAFPSMDTFNANANANPNATTFLGPGNLSTLAAEKTAASSSSSLPYGIILDRCTVPGTVSLTFDDGPFTFTPWLLDVLRANGARATFFLNGHGLGNIYDYADVVRRTVGEGHQVGSHTWSHARLTTLPRDAIIAQMLQLETAFSQILGGRVPTYMRAPFLAVNEPVLSTMRELGYHVIGASCDTKDYENNCPELIHRSLERFRNELAPGAVVLAHDIHQQTVEKLVPAMLGEIYARGWRVVPVGECLGHSPDGWYRNSRG